MAVQIYFDLETTGLSTRRDRIVSVAAICEDKEFSAWVNPGATPTSSSSTV